MSDRYLGILPFIALSKQDGLSMSVFRVFIILCDAADEDGYIVDPESYLPSIGMPLRTTKVSTMLNRLSNLGWIKQVETILEHNIWQIMLEPVQSDSVKKFIVSDGNIEVTIKSVGEKEWWSDNKEQRLRTISNVASDASKRPEV